MNRRILLPLIVLIAMLILVIPAQAGGWAVFTLEELPSQVVAGEPLTIEFAVRQHGVHLTSSFGTPAVYAKHAETGERLTFEVQRTAQEGYFTAELLFPQDGTWTWSIGWAQDSGYAQTMPPLRVQTSGSLMATPRPGAVSAPLVLGMIGLMVVVGSGVVLFSTRSRWVLGVGLAGILLAIVGLAGAVQQPASAAMDIPYSYGSQVELGKALFQAKGCVVCHTHAEGREGFNGLRTNVGPELTDTALPPEYLRVWLKDPSAVKPETQMPTLGLDDVEIDALVAFLTAQQ